ncbi:MAG: DUF4089 domain-containing protein [Lautropia sp.]
MTARSPDTGTPTAALASATIGPATIGPATIGPATIGPPAIAPEAIAAYVDAAAAALRLPLDPAHRPGVLRYFELAASFAARLDAVPLTPHDESAVRFEPVPSHGERN